MVKIGKPEEVTHFKGLIFGPPGAGKTHLLGTLEDDPRTAPTLILDFEGGVQTLVGRDIDVARIRNWKDFEEAHEVLSDEDTKYRSVGVDSLSEAQIGGLFQLLDRRGRRSADPDKIEREEWGLILVQMRRFIRGFLDLGLHTFMTALTKDDLDARAGRVAIPAFQGAFGKEVAGTFDTVGFLGKFEADDGGEERVLILHGDPAYQTKARAPYKGHRVPEEITQPDAGKVLDAIGFKSSGRTAGKGK
jgi:hypothetical protein